MTLKKIKKIFFSKKKDEEEDELSNKLKEILEGFENSKGVVIINEDNEIINEYPKSKKDETIISNKEMNSIFSLRDTVNTFGLAIDDESDVNNFHITGDSNLFSCYTYSEEEILIIWSDINPELNQSKITKNEDTSIIKCINELKNIQGKE
eukprot:TRINITY_DN7886_c0_g1_i1.p1 TRINITY_DN7886_c0_g1~~TRINITY_DN7886_c0_g1_i1.p1  ORF type:complete len:151 (+),score=20.53 TRINITY_DN7886_c0_g1_i1:65-517(+)